MIEFCGKLTVWLSYWLKTIKFRQVTKDWEPEHNWESEFCHHFFGQIGMFKMQL